MGKTAQAQINGVKFKMCTRSRFIAAGERLGKEPAPRLISSIFLWEGGKTCSCIISARSAVRKKILSPDHAHRLGWDYLPIMGKFKTVSPRTCGSCPITGTLWWNLEMEGKRIDALDKHQRQILERILNEPESIMVLQ